MKVLHLFYPKQRGQPETFVQGEQLFASLWIKMKAEWSQGGVQNDW